MEAAGGCSVGGAGFASAAIGGVGGGVGGVGGVSLTPPVGHGEPTGAGAVCGTGTSAVSLGGVTTGGLTMAASLSSVVTALSSEAE